MKVLFIGGTGIISSACSELAIERGFDLYLLTRGTSSRPIPAGANVITADYHDFDATRKALEGHTFDVVVNFIAFGVDQIEKDIALFSGRTHQYIFISSASAYHKPVLDLPITESTALHNPFWDYSRAKIACEDRLTLEYRTKGFPFTIVRPSHTYDRTKLPMFGRYTVVDRMRKGLPVVVHGDGTSIWALTHHRDFAKGFVGLLGNPHALGEAVHITTDEILTWNQIFEIVGQAAGVRREDLNLVHVSSEMIAQHDETWGTSLLGDKSHTVIFDNSKIKKLVPDFEATIPYALGAREVMAWFDADPARQVLDPHANQLIEDLVARASAQ